MKDEDELSSDNVFFFRQREGTLFCYFLFILYLFLLFFRNSSWMAGVFLLFICVFFFL
jgi:hypothetical protein